MGGGDGEWGGGMGSVVGRGSGRLLSRLPMRCAWSQSIGDSERKTSED